MRFRIEPFILKKAYCCICGHKLGRKIICVREEYTYKPFGLSLLKEKKRSYLLVLPVYKCKCCDYLIEYARQKEISTEQKETGDNILSNGKQIIKSNKVF